MLLKSEGYGLAYDAFLSAIRINSRAPTPLPGCQTRSGRQATGGRARFSPCTRRSEPTECAARVELSRVMAAGAISTGRSGRRPTRCDSRPADPHAGEQLASIVADAGDASGWSRWPISGGPLSESADPHYYQASAFFLRGRTEDALTTVHRVTDAHPDMPAPRTSSAPRAPHSVAATARGRRRASLRADPRDPSTYVNLGRFYLESANPQAAARYFAEALTIDPDRLPHEAGWLKRKRSSCRTTDSKLPNKDSKICGRLSVRLQPSMRLHLLNGGEPFQVWSEDASACPARVLLWS